MIWGFTNYIKYLVILFSFTFILPLKAQNLSLNVNADFVSRYVWRGLNVNDQPNIQPSLTLKFSNLQFGFWGSYGLSHTNSTDELHSTSHEIDTWLSYTVIFYSGVSISAIATDYYYPDSGIRIGNFNNYDNANGAGAHTVETGLSISGPESFPLSLSGYINVYNDKGNNVYFQADYFTKIQDIGVGFFVGAAAGSKDNPDYYGTDKFNLINVGVKATKQIKIFESFSLPVFCSYILNPRVEKAFLIFGISL